MMLKSLLAAATIPAMRGSTGQYRSGRFAQHSAVAGFSAAMLAALISSAIAQSGTADAAVERVTIDGQTEGRTFDGIGGVSAGASTRLLYDYPEPARSDILDYLFKPNYGAVIQILKVEIGGDMNSTSGSEPSHMRTREDLNFDRGYEWWLMHEAKKRNPDIILAALEWGAPGWIEGGFWSEDNIDYIVKWFDGAKQRGLKVEYAGGWNESGYETDWFVKLDKALKKTHPDVKIIAADDLPHHNWRVAKSMVEDPAFNQAVDVLGQHSPGTWRSLYQKYSSTPEAKALNKPLWTSEQSSLSHDVGGQAWVRGINRAYIDAQITASINWAPVGAWYPTLPHADTCQVLAEWPWSGHYIVGSTVWVYAHTSQFAQPGWKYIDSGCGYLASGASYVTFKSPNGSDYSIVIETMDAKASSTAQFTLTGGLSTGRVHVWSSNIASKDPDDDFIKERTIRPRDGTFSVTLKPGHAYTLTTTTGQRKGNARAPSSVAEQMKLPYEEDFESYEPGKLARYFSDMNGGFETAPAGGGRSGTVYRQMVPVQPLVWNLAGAGVMPPTTLMGDPRWWGDYELSTDVLLEEPGYVKLIARASAQAHKKLAGYHFQIGSDSQWRLYSEDVHKVREEEVDIASGTADFEVGKWHRIALWMQGELIRIIVNGKEVGSVRDGHHTAGNVALRVSGWHHAQFDNFKIVPTAEPPQFLPQEKLKVTATSEHTGFVRGDVFPAAYVIDGRPESFWHSEWEPEAPLPQSLTIDLGRRREVQGLTYQPRYDNVRNGIITRYNVYLSSDGREFARVTDGRWPLSTATKIARWPAQKARYVRLEAVEGSNNQATAAEIRISTSRIP